jgi:elongation factor G
VGIAEFLAALKSFCPSPVNGFKRSLVREGDKQEPKPDPAAPFVGQVFKINTDPRSNIKYLSIRVHSGTVTQDLSIKSPDHPKGTRPGHVLRGQGADHKEAQVGTAGDIVCLAKLDFAIGEVLTDGATGKIDMPKFPEPMFSLALESKSRGDEDKIAMALRRFAEEDSCFRSERGTGGELVVRGMGELQLRTYLHRMSKQYKLEVETKPPRIPYRETITGQARDIEYTHKKQSGGAGQFGRVVINVLPAERGKGYEFVDKIFGGSIDQAFRPSVDKGVRAQMAEGVIAGYPVVDVVVELTDGKTHPVDSKDIAFQIAGRGAFKEGFMKAKPVLLEPIVHIEVTCPGDNVGDIQGDLASRRGRPQGQEMIPGGMAVIKATVPLAEVADYNSRLSSITGGQGSYSLEFSHYEVVPGNVQQQIIDAHAKAVAAAHAH